MEKDLVSIIIPVYKVEKFLEKCVNSILEQTYKNLEVILVDDGSPDGCPALCDKLAKKDKRIKVIHKKNGGVSSARNMALDEAKGKYVCFVDSDDYVEPTYAEDMHTAITKNDVQMAVCEHYLIQNGNKHIISSFSHNFVLDVSDISLLSENVDKLSSPTNKMYATKFLKDTRFKTDLKYGEDQIFNFEYIEKIKSIACIHKPLYNYVEHSGSFIQSNLKQLTTYHDILFKYQQEFANRTNNAPLLKRLSSDYCFDFIISLYLIKLDKGKKEAKKHFKNCLNSNELKYLKDAITFMNTKAKREIVAKFLLKKKWFTPLYWLSKFIYKEKQRDKNKPSQE